MIVFDLKCASGHLFEGWFASSEDFGKQRESGLLTCPMCGLAEVGKAVMAPAVPAKGNQRAERADVPVSAGPDMAKMHAMMQALASAQKEALKDSQWVGRQFAEMARSMHYGEQDHRNVHGEVAPDEARALIDEGVEVAPLLFPVTPPEAQN